MPELAYPNPLRIGSRDSNLALIQTNQVIAQLNAAHPSLQTSLTTMKTVGDKVLDVAMSKIGDKGLFTKELEHGLLANTIDLVVHSLKDLPSELPAGMQLAAITRREDPRDAVILRKDLHANRIASLGDLPKGSVIGTSSVRRVAQLRALYPHLEFKDVRGNLNTRLAKLDADDAQYSGLVLAVAGVTRLGFVNRISIVLDDVLYAVGQGALGVEAREGDARVLALAAESLDDSKARMECLAERTLMRVLEGGCSVPIGVRSTWAGEGELRLDAIVASIDGASVVRESCQGRVAGEQDACALGRRVAERMLDGGARKILDAIERH